MADPVENLAEVDPDELQPHAGVVLKPDLELGHLAPAARPPDHLGHFLTGDQRGDRAVIECRQPPGRHPAQRGHVRGEGGEQQGLDQAVVGAERREQAWSRGVALETGCLLLGEPALAEQQRP